MREPSQRIEREQWTGATAEARGPVPRARGWVARVFAIATNTTREAIRSKVLYSILFFSAFVVAIAAAFGTVSLGDQMKFVKDFSLMSISLFGVVIAVVLGVNLLDKEIGRKTIYNILSKPVRRWEFIVGKFAGLWFTLAVVLSAMSAGLVLFLFLIEGRIDPGLAIASLAALLEITIIVAIALFFSAIVVTPTLAGLFTAATFVAGRSCEYLRYGLQGRPRNSTAGPTDILYWIIPHLDRFDIADQVVYGNYFDVGYFVMLATYSAGYTGLLLLVTIVIFERRELS